MDQSGIKLGSGCSELGTYRAKGENGVVAPGLRFLENVERHVD